MWLRVRILARRIPFAQWGPPAPPQSSHVPTSCLSMENEVKSQPIAIPFSRVTGSDPAMCFSAHGQWGPPVSRGTNGQLGITCLLHSISADNADGTDLQVLWQLVLPHVGTLHTWIPLQVAVLQYNLCHSHTGTAPQRLITLMSTPKECGPALSPCEWELILTLGTVLWLCFHCRKQGGTPGSAPYIIIYCFCNTTPQTGMHEGKRSTELLAWRETESRVREPLCWVSDWGSGADGITTPVFNFMVLLISTFFILLLILFVAFHFRRCIVTV